MINEWVYKCNLKIPQVQIKLKDVLDKFKRLPLNYQSKIGYDTLIQNVIDIHKGC